MIVQTCTGFAEASGVKLSKQMLKRLPGFVGSMVVWNRKERIESGYNLLKDNSLIAAIPAAEPLEGLNVVPSMKSLQTNMRIGDVRSW